MYNVKKVNEDLYWIGASDRRLALFENIYPIPRGVSYNSYVILDEHTAALDPKTAEIIMELTDQVVKEKKVTTIMVTHNLRYAVEYGNRLIMMHEGKAILDKTGEEKKSINTEEIMAIFNKISVECGN